MTRKTYMAAAAAMFLFVTMLVTGTNPAGAVPVMTATPSTGLIDGQVVHVEVTGLQASTLAGIALCIGSHGYDGCDSSDIQLISTDADGHFSTDYAVQAILNTPLGTFDCRDAANACGLAANTSYTDFGAALLGVSFDPTGPLLPPPTATATPSTGLIDRQSIHITGSGFRPNRSVAMVECIGGSSDYYKCSNSYDPYPTVATDGTIDATMAVRTLLHAIDGTTVDCRTSAGACEIQVGSPDQPTNRIHLPLAFDPNAPLAPPPTMDVTPSTGLIDGQVVTVTGHGFFPNTPIGISECATTTSVGSCSGGTTAFSDTDGTISIDVPVRARLWAGEILDCRDASVDCSLQAYSYVEPDDNAVTSLSFDPNGPLLPPPVLTAHPDTDLVDGQTVTLTGSHLGYPFGPIFLADHSVRPASARWVPPVDPRKAGRVQKGSGKTTADDTSFQVPVFECAAGSQFLDRCSQFTGTALVDSSGNLTGQMQLWATFSTFDGATVDCRTSATACELRAGYGDPLTAAVTPISFDPNAPLAPPPTVTVTPDTGLVNGAELHVVGDGFPAYTFISFHQCLAGETGLDGCDTDLYGGASTDANGHLDATTNAKEVIGLGTDGNPYSTTFDCGSSPNACRLLMVDSFGPEKWPSVTLDYAGSTVPVTPATPPSEVVVSPVFTG